jgi:hypothetical protein
MVISMWDVRVSATCVFVCMCCLFLLCSIFASVIFLLLVLSSWLQFNVILLWHCARRNMACSFMMTYIHYMLQIIFNIHSDSDCDCDCLL